MKTKRSIIPVSTVRLYLRARNGRERTVIARIRARDPVATEYFMGYWFNTGRGDNPAMLMQCYRVDILNISLSLSYYPLSPEAGPVIDPHIPLCSF